MIKGLVNKILPFSSVDGPGNRSVIFLQGCNFNCLYCHNPETINICNSCGTCVNTCPYDSLKMVNEEVSWNSLTCKSCDRCLKVCPRNSSPKTKLMNPCEVMEQILKIKSFISGITVSGGECTLQWEFLTELFKEAKKYDLTTFIDTNGSFPFYDHPGLLKVTDSTMIDLKAYDPKEHFMLTGKSNTEVIENINYLGRMNKLFEIRSVVVPGLLNNHFTISKGSELISSINPLIKYKIIKFRPLGVRSNLINAPVPTDDLMEELKSIALKNGCKDVVIV